MIELATTLDRQRASRPLPGSHGSPAMPRELAERLETEAVVWVSSTRPDGAPHLVPTWFTWDGTVVWIFSKPGAQKVRNLARHPRVMLAVGSAHPEFDVELIEGDAAVLDQPTRAVLPRGGLARYAAPMARLGWTYETYTERYSQPIAITPSRVLDWHSREVAGRRHV